MAAPAIGPQRYTTVSDQRPGMLANQPKWVWYAGGALIGVGVLLWIRSRGTQSGPALVSTPSTNTQSELGNVNDSLLGLQALIQGRVITPPTGSVNPQPSSINAGYVPTYGQGPASTPSTGTYTPTGVVYPAGQVLTPAQIQATQTGGYTLAELQASQTTQPVDAGGMTADERAQLAINIANDPAAFGY